MGKSVFLAALAVLFSLSSYATSVPELKDPKLAAIGAKTPRFEDIEKILEQSPPHGDWTIADVLSTLRESYPDYFDYYVLNYSSLAVQQSSRENPRIIVHGNGNTLLAFNGDPSQRGYGHLEIIEYKGPHEGYSFRAVLFDKDGSRLRLPDNEIEKRIGSVTISKSNPHLCQACHGSEPRPIWDQYDLWGGFYGSSDDALFLFGRAVAGSGRLVGPDLETPGWHQLQSTFAANPRYAVLGGALRGFGFLDTERKRINLNLNKIFSYQMSARLLDAIEDNPEALELVAAVQHCKPKLPQAMIAENSKLVKDALARQKSHFEKAHESAFDLAEGPDGFMSGNTFVSKMTAFERTFEKSSHISLKSYSYSRIRGLDLQDGGGGLRYIGGMADQILRERHHREFDLSRCTELNRKIIED